MMVNGGGSECSGGHVRRMCVWMGVAWGEVGDRAAALYQR